MKSWLKKISSEEGFTLVEVLVSLVMLSVALTPIAILATNAINSADTIRDNVIAANLAQEGIEVIRAIRDTNWTAIPSRSFDNGLSAGNYEVTWNSVPPLDAYQDRFLRLGSEGRYKYNGASSVPTQFKRKITIGKPSAAELKVESEVTWNNRLGAQSIKVEDHLFDWRY